jgi:hypothetical protein
MVRAWKVRSRPGGIEVPIRDPRVALLYRRMGWEAFSARVPELGNSNSNTAPHEKAPPPQTR